MANTSMLEYREEINWRKNDITKIKNALAKTTLPAEKDIYRLKIIEHKKALNLALIVKKIQESQASAAKNSIDLELEKKFIIAYEDLYQTTPIELVKSVLNKEKTIHNLKRLNEFKPIVYQQVIDKLSPYINQNGTSPTCYNKNTYSGLWNSVASRVNPFLEGVVFEDKDLNSDVVKKILEKVLINIHKCEGISNQWSCRIYEESPTFSINHTNKRINIPPRSRNGIKLKGLVYHEIFTHVLRSIYAHKLNVISSLPGYKVFEEGLGKTLQNLAENKSQMQLESYYQPTIVALSHAGLSLAEIEEFLRIDGTPNYNKYLKRAAKRTIKRRFSIETSRDMPLYPKDMSYGVGGKLVHHMCKRHINTSDKHLKSALKKVFDAILLCKFDPTNTSHIAYILEKNVINFESHEQESYKNFLGSEELLKIRQLMPIIT